MRTLRRVSFGVATSAAATCLASTGSSSFQDKAADVLAIVVIIVVPVVAIAVFWLVHIIPEKVAEKRHHPQKEAIKVLCLLSLVFGGLLWPFAWLWAYSKPVFHKMAYGRDKHDDYYLEQQQEGEPDASQPDAIQEELVRMRLELEALSERAEVSDAVPGLKQRLAELEHRHMLSHSKHGAP